MRMAKLFKELSSSIGVGALIGAALGFGCEDLHQHFEKIGVAATLFGAQLGLLGYDWRAMSKAAVVGAGAGAALGAIAMSAALLYGAVARRKQAQRLKA